MKFLPFRKKTAPGAEPEGRGGRGGGGFGPGSEPGGGKPPPSRFARRFKVISISLASVVTLVQIGGLLFRDTLEGRTPAVRAEPLLAAIAAAAPKAPEEHRLQGRGFGVAEVEIGTPPGGHAPEHAEEPPHHPAEPAKMAEPPKKEEHATKSEARAGKSVIHAPKAESAKKDERPKAVEHEKPKAAPKVSAQVPETPKPPPARKAPALAKATAEPAKPAEPAPTPAPPPPALKPQKPAPAPAPKDAAAEKAPEREVVQAKSTGRERFQADPRGGYAVAVGAFNSPRLAQMMEQRLDDLGFPHLRISTMKEAEGYTLTLSAESDAVLQNARKAVLDNGYKLEKTSEGLTSRFFTEEEANKAKAIAERGGALAAVKKAAGQTPLWRILVGPTSAQNAAKAQETLKGEGIDCVTVRYKP